MSAVQVIWQRSARTAACKWTTRRYFPARRACATKHVVAVKTQFADVSRALSDSPVDATTHEGMMRLLQQKQIELPTGIISPRAMSGLIAEGEGAEVLDRGFPWQDHEYLDGDEQNAQTLKDYENMFAAQTGARPPEWSGLELALDDPENLRASLDLSVAYIKNYELDKCEILLGRFALPACRVRGLPWIAKALQDYATLRMKQNRQAEAMMLLEKLESMLPPHPIMLHNLGLAYNSLRMHEKAMDAFNKAVDLNSGHMYYDDYWNMGITLKHMKKYKQAFPLLIKALEMAPLDAKVDDVTLAKLNDTIGTCLQNPADEVADDKKKLKRSLAQEAEPYFREAVELYDRVLGNKHHLYGGACHLLGKNLMSQDRGTEAEPWLYEALWIEVLKNGMHPTPCHAMVMDLLTLHERGALPDSELSKYHDPLRVMLMHMHSRGFAADGNGGVVMQAIARFLLLSGQELARPALALLKQGLKLVENHKQDVDDTSWIQLTIRLEMKQAQDKLALPAPPGTAAPAVQSERWLLEGPWGIPAGSDVALGICAPATEQQYG